MDQETFDRIKEEAIEEVLKKHFKGSLKTQEKVAMHQLLEELLEAITVSYTHLTLPTNREV